MKSEHKTVVTSEEFVVITMTVAEARRFARSLLDSRSVVLGGQTVADLTELARALAP